MSRHYALAPVALGFCALGLFASPALAAKVPVYVTAAIADPARPKDEVAADVLRLPAETIAFAGVRPGMVVAELGSGGGYYTRLLAKAVGPGGTTTSGAVSVTTDFICL